MTLVDHSSIQDQTLGVQKHYAVTGRDFLLFILLALISGLPYLINGLAYLVPIHDNLDSNVVWFKLISQQSFFSFSPQVYIHGVMADTIPRNNFPDALKINAILFYLLEAKIAFLTNLLLNKFLAVTAIYLLVRDYVFRNSYKVLTCVLALLYSLLPTYSIYGAGNLCGFLLLLWAALKFLETDRKRYWLVFILLPFTTSLIFFDLFALPVLVVILWFFYGKLDLMVGKRLLVPFGLFIVFVSIANSHTLVSFFIPAPHFVSHRLEFIKEAYTLMQCFSNAIHYFLYGFYHAPANPKYIAIGFMPFLAYKVWKDGLTRRNRLLVVLLILQVFFALVFGFWFWKGLTGFKSVLPFFNVLDMTRMAFLSQPLWYLMFAFMIYDIAQNVNTQWRYVIISIMLLVQLTYIYANNREMDANIRHVLDAKQAVRDDYASFETFYLPKTFDKVKADLPEITRYRTIMIGEHPAVTAFNGLEVLDFYFPSYDLHYKEKFGRIIERELAKDQEMAAYFHNYGSRCYAFAAAYYGPARKNSSLVLTLAYDWTAFKELGGKYVLSFFPITNRELILDREYEISENSYHSKLFVYRYE